MEARFPSASSPLPFRRHEIRRRSGQAAPSPTPESDWVTSTTAYSPSWRVSHHLQNVPEGDPLHSRSEDAPFPESFPVTPRLAKDNLRSPTIKLLNHRGNDSQDTRFSCTDSSKDSAYLRVEAPLPPLPEEGIRGYDQPENENNLSPIPLTPRPGGPSRFPSQDSQTSNVSQRSIFSQFPRLPTPDFTVLRRNPLKQVINTPFEFLRARATSFASVPSSRRSNIRLESNKRPDSFQSSQTSPVASAQPEQFPPISCRTESFESAAQDIKTSSTNTVCDDELHYFLTENATTRFTRKFPSSAAVSSFGGSISKQDMFEGIVASESGNDLGVESVGRWTGYKWCLLLSVLTVFGYAMVGLVYSILTWFGARSHADVVWVTDNDILMFITFASTLLLLAALVGLSGTLLNSRPILAFYALLLWPSFVSVLVVGYTSYKREAFSLDRKLNMAWSQWYDDLGRLLIQESLHCCGFYNPLHEATFSKNCYPRTSLPGCKGKLFRFEKDHLRQCWRLAFSLVPLHVLNITASLLCSNHVDRRFGKGLTPRAYRLRIADVRANADIVLARFGETNPPLVPSRSLSHVMDREDRPATSRMQYGQGQMYEAIGQNFLRS